MARSVRALPCALALLMLFPAASQAVIDDNVAANFTISGTAGDDTIAIDDGSTGDGRIRVTVNGTDIEFKNKTNVTVAAGTGNDTITIANTETADGLSRMTVNAGSEAGDTVSTGAANYTGGTLFIEGGTITDTDGFATNVTATSFGVRTTRSVGTNADPIEVAVSNLEVESGADQYILATSAVRVGGVSGDDPTTGAVEPELGGLHATGTGDVGLLANGITLNDTDGPQMVRADGGGVGLASFGSNNDLVAVANHDAIATPGGEIVLQSDRDIKFGTEGNFDNDVRGAESVFITADRDITIDGDADIESDAFGTDAGEIVSLAADRELNITDAIGTDASVAANGSAGAPVGLSGGTINLSAQSASAVVSTSADVTLNADKLVIASDSGATATNSVAVRPATPGRAVDLGSATDASAAALEVSDGELDRLFTQNALVGDGPAGTLTVTSPVDAANAPELTIMAGQGGLAATGSGSVNDTTVRFREGTSSSRAWQVRASGVEGVPYNASSRLRVEGGSAADRFEVQASPTTPYTIDGNNPGTAPGDAFHYDTEGRTTGGDSTAPDGQITSPGFQAVDFQEIERAFVGDDFDDDGFVDGGDNCEQNANPDQANTDGDAQGDACDADDDNDGVSDTVEAAGGTNPLVADSDADGLNDGADNCATVANADQADADGDGRGNACDDTPFPPPAANQPTPPSNPVAPVLTSSLRLSHLRVRLSRGKVRLVLNCAGDAGASCKGKVSLLASSLSRRPRPAGRSGKSTAFDIGAGRRKTVLVAVPATTRRQLDRRGRAVAYAVIDVTKPGGGTTRRRVAITLVD